MAAASVSNAILSEREAPQLPLPVAVHEARVLKLQLGSLRGSPERAEVVVGILKHFCGVLEYIQSTTSLVLQGQRVADNRMELTRAVLDGLGGMS